MSIRVQCRPAVLTAIRGQGLDSLDGAFSFAGGSSLTKGGLKRRRRDRITLTDADGRTHLLYLKRYGPEGLLDRLRRIRTYGLRATPAGVESDNIRAAGAAGIATMEVLVCGQEPGWLSSRRSYLLVTSVPGEALERCFAETVARCGVDSATVAEVTTRLAELARTLHQAGYVHRDFYASHIFLDHVDDRVVLYLIDLARMFRPRWRRFRWRVKDLAQLKYSMPAEWVEAHWPGFLETYFAGGRSLRHRYERAIDRKVAAMRKRGAGRPRRRRGPAEGQA